MSAIATASYGSIYAQTCDDPRIRGLLARDPRLDDVATGLLVACAIALIACSAGLIAILA